MPNASALHEWPTTYNLESDSAQALAWPWHGTNGSCAPNPAPTACSRQRGSCPGLAACLPGWLAAGWLCTPVALYCLAVEPTLACRVTAPHNLPHRCSDLEGPDPQAGTIADTYEYADYLKAIVGLLLSGSLVDAREA